MSYTSRIFVLLILFFALCSSSFAAKKPTVCHQEYAICSSAQCIPDPRHKGFALCACHVENGANAGYSSCEQRKPVLNQDNTTRLLSTFSLFQVGEKKSMSCSKGYHWTNCLDSPCTINPMDRTKAICSCPVVHNQAFVTFGGDCNMKTCATGFWSGATKTQSEELRNTMQKTTNTSTTTNVACPNA